MINRAGTKNSHAVIVLDGSGSMSSVLKNTISGFNEFIQSQRESEIDTNISIYTFHGNSVERIVNNQPAISVADLNEYTYSVHGMTNLLDAIGQAISDTNELLTETEPPSIIFCVITDGEENSSREYNNERIKTLVSECEAAEWVFMFLGANIDAFVSSAKIGFNSKNTLQYDTANMSAAMTAVSFATERAKLSRSSGAITASVYDSMFTAQDRESNGF